MFTIIDVNSDNVYNNIHNIRGEKGLSPHELAHKWVKDLGTRPDMSIKEGKYDDEKSSV